MLRAINIFRKDLKLGFAYLFMCIILSFAFFAEFLANDAPILSFTEKGPKISAFDKNYEPAMKNKLKIKAFIPYSASSQNLSSRNLPPFSENHLLGTDHLGRDVFANLIYGSRTSVASALCAVFLACTSGLLIGCIAGYFGDNSAKIHIMDLLLILIISFLTYYYIFYLEPSSSGILIYIALCLLLLLMRYRFHHKLHFSKYMIPLPIDFIIVKCMEVFNSLPNLLLVIALAAFLKPSVMTMVLVIAVSKWCTIAKISRAETLKLKNMGYVEAAWALGAGFWQILKVHLLPNLFTSVVVASSFAFAGSIILESTLSFLGVGVPVGTASWGAMLAHYKYDLDLWWIAVFPGLTISFTILSIHKIGSHLEKKFTRI